MIEAKLIDWRNRHDSSLRADRGALARRDRPSCKAARQRDAYGHASPIRLASIGTDAVQKTRQLHRATRQGSQPSHRHAVRMADFLNAMTFAPLDQRGLNPERPASAFHIANHVVIAEKIMVGVV